MVDVALFELEGVLFDTAELRREALRGALDARGIPAATCRGDITPEVAARQALTAAGVDCDEVLIDLIALDAARAYSAALATAAVAMTAGARALVEDAALHGRVGIVTRSTRRDASTLLVRAGMETIATMMICADDVLDPKPSPEGYLMALDRLGRQRSARPSVIALEDGVAGIRAARAAGVRCVAVGALAAHAAMEADAGTTSLEGHTLASLERLASPGRERVQ